MSDDQENIDPSKPTEKDCKDPDEDFDLESSDDDWEEPTPDEIVELFEKLTKEKVLKLDWTSPGRRPPTPATKFDFSDEEDNTKENIPEEKSDFDFQDETFNLKFQLKEIRPAGAVFGVRGSAKKKTVSLDAILSNMARHRKLDMMEDDDEDPLP